MGSTAFADGAARQSGAERRKTKGFVAFADGEDFKLTRGEWKFAKFSEKLMDFFAVAPGGHQPGVNVNES